MQREVIAVNQDRLGIQGRFQKSVNDIEIWTRPLSSEIGNTGRNVHDFAVAFVSQRTDGQPYKIRVDLRSIGLTNELGYKVQVSVVYYKSIKICVDLCAYFVSVVESIRCVRTDIHCDLRHYGYRIPVR